MSQIEPTTRKALEELNEVKGKEVDGSLIVRHFKKVNDFRRKHLRLHVLSDILIIAVLATLADRDGFVEFANFGKDQLDWLKGFLQLPNGIPSHDTFRRILLRLDPVEFQQACVDFALELTSNQQPPNPPSCEAATSSNPCLAAFVALGLPEATDSQLDRPQPTDYSALLPSCAADANSSVTPATIAADLLLDCGLATPSPVDAACQPAESVSLSLASDSTCRPNWVRPSRQPIRLPWAKRKTSTSYMVRPVGWAGGIRTQPQSGKAVKLPKDFKPTFGLPNNLERVAAIVSRRHLAIDGKTLRGTIAKSKGVQGAHSVTIWDCEARLTLAQVMVEEKSNEITAIPKVLSLTDLHGTVISIDAAGTQEKVIKEIKKGGGDYVLAVKGNQPHLYEDVLLLFGEHFDKLAGQPDKNILVVRDKPRNGRKETRSYVVIEYTSGLRHEEKWPGVKRLIMVTREFEKPDGRRGEETRYFIGSVATGAEDYAKWVRGHWGIENRVHWILDVIFVEDSSRVRTNYGPENLAMLRRLSLGILANDKTSDRSIKGKRKQASTSRPYLANLIR